MVIIECKSTEIIIFENIIITDENIRKNTDALKYFYLHYTYKFLFDRTCFLDELSMLLNNSYEVYKCKTSTDGYLFKTRFLRYNKIQILLLTRDI